MKIKQVKNLSPMGVFCYWINERNDILEKRRFGRPKPWTNDEILQTHYFTNVDRENDKVTKWFRENVREPLRYDPAVLFATICFRWFNYIPTGEILIAEHRGNLLLDWNLKEAIERLETLKMRGEQVFTGAFNISNSGSPKPKINRVCEDYIQPAWDERKELLRAFQEWHKVCPSQPFVSLKNAHKWISNLPGLGGSGFMAAQVVADLKHTYLLEDASDWWTWCSPGPGSRRGLNVLLGREPELPLVKGWDEEINKLRYTVSRRTGCNLDAQNLQNCLCEYFKYTRALKTGRSKRRYDGSV